MSRKGSDKLALIREKIKGLPTGPGLYFMKGVADKVLYIGKAKNLRSRVSSYFQEGSDLAATRGPKITEMISKVKTVDILETETEVDATFARPTIQTLPTTKPSLIWKSRQERIFPGFISPENRGPAAAGCSGPSQVQRTCGPS